MWFRSLLAICSVMLFGLALWLGTHVSDSPVVFGRWSPGYASMLGFFVGIATLVAALAGPFYGFVHPSRQNIVVLSIASVVSIAIAEGIVRTFDFFGISYYADSERYLRAKIPDPHLYYIHEPNSVETFRDFSVRINSLGMRGNEVPAPDSSEIRILFLGDSVTFGWGVNESSTFVARAGALLGERLQNAVRTLNSGVGSYNTQNQLAFLERHGEQLAPDVIALAYVVNDIELTPSTPFDPRAGAQPGEMSPPQLLVWLIGKSWLYRVLVHLERYAKPQPASMDTSLLRDGQGWKASFAAVEEIAEWSAKHSAPFILYLIRMTKEPLGDALTPSLSALANERGFVFIDTIAWFESVDVREATNSIVDVHPNAKGHAILAEGMASTIEEVLRSE